MLEKSKRTDDGMSTFLSSVTKLDSKQGLFLDLRLKVSVIAFKSFKDCCNLRVLDW